MEQNTLFSNGSQMRQIFLNYRRKTAKFSSLLQREKNLNGYKPSTVKGCFIGSIRNILKPMFGS